MFYFTQKKALLLTTLLLVNLGLAQVGIGTTTPDADAELDITSTTRGVLLPRVPLTATTSPAPLSADVAGMIVYNTATAGDVTPGFYYNDGTDWIRLGAGIPVDNGLNYDAVSQTNQLGGALVENTTITQGTFQMNFNLDSTGDFNIQDAGVTHFQVQDNGRINFGEDTYWRDGSVAGTILGRFYDSGNDGIMEIYRNGAVQHRLHGNGVSVFNEQSQNFDFRIESDTATDAFFLEGSDGQITLGDYGGGAHTGTATQMLAVDAAGNIIEEPLVAGSNDWALLGNAGTNPATNFVGTTDAQDLVMRSNNVERLRLGTTEAVFNEPSNNYDFRIESDGNTRMLAVDAGDDQVRINDGAGFFTSSHFISSTDNADDAMIGYTDGAGYGLYAQSDGTAAGAIVSITAATSTSIPFYAFPINVAPGVYSDVTSSTDSDDAVVGIADNEEGFGGGWFLNVNTGGNGSGYGTAEQGYGVLGMNNTGNQYSVGAFGAVDDSGRRSSGVYGSNSNGTTSVASGALAYRTSVGSNYYGGYFWDNNGGTDHIDGTGRSSSSSNIKVNVGFGAIGGLMGGWSKGDIYGFTTKGDRYSLYVDGREYTNDVITQLSTTNNSRQRTASYVPTSTTVDITSKGSGMLTNGSARINFKKDFSSLASSKEPVIVTVTPLGQSNGVYIESIDKNGFTIRENNNGTSTVQFTWIAIATKAGYETVETPEELLASDYDEHLDNFMINENLANENDGKNHNMWWDGSKIKYTPAPSIESYSRNKIKSKVYKPKKKLQPKKKVVRKEKENELPKE